MAVTLVAACAQQAAPSGGPADLRPPVVVATTPDTFAVVPGYTGSIRFDFDERISEQVEGGELDRAVVVSPRTGDVRVQHQRRSIVIEVDGGFEPDRVYRVTLLPVIRDLFGNQIRDPFELVFSTGPPPVATTIAGLVWDRITGRGAAGFEVQGVAAEDDSSMHVAMTDTGGVFALRFIPTVIPGQERPAGRFQMTAYEDRNRDGVVDQMEVQGRQERTVLASDTVYLDIPVLQPDTTPAHIASVTPLDSLTVLIELDDYLEPELPVAGVVVTVVDSDSVSVQAMRVFHEYEYVAYAERIADSLAVLDSIDRVAFRAEAAVRDSAAAARVGDSANVAATDTVTIEDPGAPERPEDPGAAEAEAVQASPEPRVAPPGLDGRPTPRPPPPNPAAPPPAAATGPGGERLPSTQLVAILGAPLVRDSLYQIRVSQVRNIMAIPLGGGEAEIVLASPEVPDTASAADSVAVPDTGAVPDTAVVRDTSAARDTAARDPGARDGGARTGPLPPFARPSGFW